MNLLCLLFYSSCNVGAVLEVAPKVIIQGPFNLYPPRVQDVESLELVGFLDSKSDRM